ncbi:heterokaryon incompatibility protein-domain-containing protein [Tricladium varicosporioides]|nr:heterokaryon incompatibility protein-domain-containing protein [Hymenoscyphus varicosporioides]
MNIQVHRSHDALNLCGSCEKIDFNAFFSNETEVVPETGRPLISLGRPPKDLSKVDCTLCQLFFSVSTTYKRKYQQQVRLFDRIKQSDDQLNTSPPSPFMSVIRENSRLQYDHRIQNEIGQRGVVVYRSHEKDKCQTIRDIKATIDYEQVDSWISNCKGHHTQCSRNVNPTHVLEYLNLIDCIDYQIVKREPTEQYLALSYVWGTPVNTEPQSQDPINSAINFSFNNAPLTIRDAITATRNLRRRYLWVDRYCINQEQPYEKYVMLQNMDQIYENAEATLVALYGDNDTSGLPGVSQVPRSCQRRFPLHSGDLISSCPPISNAIANSTWVTRGWTYQEARLSRRCLFFTEYQVYFVCAETSQSEALPIESNTSWLATVLNSSRLNAGLFGTSTIEEGIFRDRLMFTQRSLTQQSDILDAFRGLLSRTSFITLWGVPVMPREAIIDPSLGLALGLLWGRRPDSSVSRHVPSSEVIYKRRPGFPTWSWTSIEGEIHNDGYDEASPIMSYYFHSSVVRPESLTLISFCLLSDTGNPPCNTKEIPLQEVIRGHASNILPELSPYLSVIGDIAKVRLSRDNETFGFCGLDGQQLGFGGRVQFDTDEDIEQASDVSVVHDALILFEWNDAQAESKRQMVLMLLRWIDTGKAERVGLLAFHKYQGNPNILRSLPRTHQQFILQ